MKDEHGAVRAGIAAAGRRPREPRAPTRRELAKKSGVSERFLANLETGQGNISVARLHDVARALGTSAGELLPADRPQRPPLALVGLRRAGKSTLGRQLAQPPPVPFVAPGA